METQGQYDFAIFGENLSAWIAALLLARQGDRVLILPEQRDEREFVGRTLFGLEPGGILLRMLENWGLPRASLHNQARARMECLTPETTLWIQGSLRGKALGAPAFELAGSEYEKLLQVVDAMEENDQWKEVFVREFVQSVRMTTDKKLRHIPLLPGAAATWKRIVRRVMSPQVKGVRLPKQASTGEGTGRLLRGLGHLLYREESWIRRSPHPIQVASDLFALRNAYFSEEVYPALRDAFRTLLRSVGVEFLPEGIYPHFKRDSSGRWEAIFENPRKELSLMRFDQMIFARQLEPSTLSRFEDEARKSIEADLQAKEIDRYEMDIRFKRNPFPFDEAAELVSRSPSGGWVRLSLYRDPETLVRVGAWIPTDAVKVKGDARVFTERRLLREIQESLPGLAIDSENAEVRTEVHRERRFKSDIGVSGAVKRVWHAHHQSYPEMGEFGPVIAAIEIARKRARKMKRELMI